MEAKAVARFVRVTPRKARFVIDAVRGKNVHDALAILKFTPNNAARVVEKLLKSAVANAENNHHMNADLLKISRAHVDHGPTMKRIQPRAMGRAYAIMKRSSHITIAVEEGEEIARRTHRKQVAQVVSKAKQKRGAKAEAEAPKAKAAKGKAKATEPETKAAKPETKPVEPETEAVEPEAQAAEPETEAIEPEAQATEPEEQPAEPGAAEEAPEGGEK